MLSRLMGVRKTTPYLEKLRKLPLFAELSIQELAILAALLHVREYVAGEIIFDEGETGQAMYVILEGEVTICRQGRPEDGFLTGLLPGEFFGELGLLDDAIRTAQARAASHCRVAVLFREDFNGLMESHLRIAHKIGRQLLRHLGERLRELGIAVGNHRHL
ncbi:MAG TPA: cyclic nucleotide-binding domain-containing protein [Rhodocyclaceae bacterium]|nr:cyclic nucleotide-binding domain-containing protein [Rhodocyclaceae bacterium]